MRKVLPRLFFDRNACIVARQLLGMYLVVHGRGYVITETEAYIGPHDKACHAYKGRTNRTEVMFGPPGHWYIYLIYGMYWMLNVVTGEKGYPAAVLIRGVKEYPGPGKLTKALHISKRYHGLPVAKRSKCWIEDRGVHVPKKCIQTTPRIGIAYAGEWRDKPYRFILDDSCVFGDFGYNMEHYACHQEHDKKNHENRSKSGKICSSQAGSSKAITR